MKISKLFIKLNKRRNKVLEIEKRFQKALKKEFKEIEDVDTHEHYPVILLKDDTHTHAFFNIYDYDLYFKYHELDTCIKGKSADEVIKKTSERIIKLEQYLEFGKKLYKRVLNKKLDVEKFNIYQLLQKLKGN